MTASKDMDADEYQQYMDDLAIRVNAIFTGVEADDASKVLIFLLAYWLRHLFPDPKEREQKLEQAVGTLVDLAFRKVD